MEITDNETTFQVNGEPVERQAPKQGITEEEIKEFDQVARASFEQELHKHQEIRPGSPEAQEAIREAIRQGK